MQYVDHRCGKFREIGPDFSMPLEIAIPVGGPPAVGNKYRTQPIEVITSVAKGRIPVLQRRNGTDIFYAPDPLFKRHGFAILLHAVVPFIKALINPVSRHIISRDSPRFLRNGVFGSNAR
jgi:hypothetical protein